MGLVAVTIQSETARYRHGTVRILMPLLAHRLRDTGDGQPEGEGGRIKVWGPIMPTGEIRRQIDALGTTSGAGGVANPLSRHRAETIAVHPTA